MKKIALLLCFFTSFLISAQDEETQPGDEVLQVPQTSFWDHVRFGGGIGLAFGSNQTTIEISPSAIYEFNDMFAFGLGTSYLYSKNFDFKSNVYGIGLISLFNPFEEFQMSAEFEQLFVNQKLIGFEDLNFNYPALHLGAAYRMGWISAGIRYDVLYDESKNIYASPWSPIFRIYF